MEGASEATGQTAIERHGGRDHFAWPGGGEWTGGALPAGRHTYDFVTGRGPVTAQQLATHLLPVLAPDVLLVSDAAKAYGAFARRAGITHEIVNVRAGIRARGALHIQGVNGWHSRFKNWLRRFHGVASRYLANYTAWQRVLDAATLPLPADWLRVAVAPRKQLARQL